MRRDPAWLSQADRLPARFGAVAVALAVVCAACTPTLPPSPTGLPASTAPLTASPTLPPISPAPQRGGTIYVLTQREEIDQLDPQRIYAAEDLAFFGATLYRSLESYTYSADPVEGTTLTPDLATDLGRPTDGGRTWAFTLRDGVTFQTGDPITCEDLKYGVSRTFATDMINQGPTYAVFYLDIPKDADGASSYKGPYTATSAQQALYHKAVECSTDNRTITFHLNRPVADFNNTTTLGFFPVPMAADTGETYGTTPTSRPVSTGPYQVESYTKGTGGKLVLVRNPAWNPASDPIRKAYPDRWEIAFDLDLYTITQRLIDAQGTNAFALTDSPLEPERVRTVFEDPDTPYPAFAPRAIAGFDPYVRYLWINTQRVTNVKIRQAMMVALDRNAARELRGGAFSGTFADGVLKPTIGQDYAPTGIWDTFFGHPIPTSGDPDLARQLIAESDETPPTLAFSAADTPTNQATFKVIKESLGKAGLQVEYKPPCIGYCSIVFAPYSDVDFGLAGWAADWPNASTVIPPLFTDAGGWNLSKVNDPAVLAAIDDSFATADRREQAGKWQALSREAVDQAWIIPTFFGRQQRLAGTNVGPIYLWPAYSSWPYAEMYTTP